VNFLGLRRRGAFGIVGVLILSFLCVPQAARPISGRLPIHFQLPRKQLDENVAESL
jgi:hypothetical protein